MFKVGDIVEITKESSATGMLDFLDGGGYEVFDYREVVVAGKLTQQIYVYCESGQGGWYAASHFKLEEGAKVEKKECLFKEGQVVWDLRNGRGVVVETFDGECYPVIVKFDLKDEDGDEIIDSYTADGRFVITQNIRSLYFSEPKVEAATEPLCGTESLFTQGDSVLCRVFGQGTVLSVSGEDDEVHVEFKDIGTRNYTLGGKLYDLFPDEVVTLSTVKQAFTPMLKNGDAVVAVDSNGQHTSLLLAVTGEDEHFVKTLEFGVMGKQRWDFYRLGEKINFK